MIVDAAPALRAPDEWIVPIIDSSGGHGGEDRRSKSLTGLGRGTIVLVRESGALVGVRWRESSRVIVRTEVAMARLE
jgi:hypothetical protein